MYIFKFISFFAIITFFFVALISCKGNNSRPEAALNYFSRRLENNDLDEVALTIYYMSPFVLTRMPVSVSDLRDGMHEYRVVVESSELKEHIDLLRTFTSESLISAEQRGGINARIYYVFETASGHKLIDVVMWSEHGNIIVNGYEFKRDDVFYDIIMPFLPERAYSEIRAFLSHGIMGYRELLND